MNNNFSLYYIILITINKKMSDKYTVYTVRQVVRYVFLKLKVVLSLLLTCFVQTQRLLRRLVLNISSINITIIG